MIKKWLEEFYLINPKGTKDEFIDFIRTKEEKHIEELFEKYKNGQIKKLSDEMRNLSQN